MQRTVTLKINVDLYILKLDLKIMGDTYLQMHVHLVFATKHREASIKKEWRDDLEKYIAGIVQNHKHKMLAIKSVSDHIHIFIGYNVNHLIPKLVEEIKTSSSRWIKENYCIKKRHIIT